MSASERLSAIEERIQRACDEAGRDRKGVTLIAVSKTKSAEAIRELYDLGIRDFGESRLQEALPKIEALPKDICWHFIGHLQSNKAKKIASVFDVIHTVCNEGQLSQIARQERTVDVLVEVNVAQEPQKTGIIAVDLDAVTQLVIQCTRARLRGLMTIGPALEDPEAMRPYFRIITSEAARLGLEWISMGMSHDFDVAVQEGATHIRVGTALFGTRQ